MEGEEAIGRVEAPGREVRGAEWKISVPYCPKGDLMGGGTGQGWLIS